MKIYNYLAEKVSRFLNYPCDRPRGSDLIVTYGCNFQCTHCDIWQEKDKKELTVAEWLKVIKNLRAWLGPNYLISVGGGEPLLRPDIFVILDALVKNNFRVILESNGFLVDEEKAEKIVKSGIEEVRISLYSLTPSIHNEMRNVSGAQEKAVAALLNLAKMRNQHKAKLKISLGLLLNQKNIGVEAQNLINWAKANNFHVTIQVLDENFRGNYKQKEWFKNNPLWPQDKKIIESFFDWLIQKKQNDGLIANSKKTLQSFKEYFLNPNKTAQWPCQLDFRTFNIDPLGMPFFCYKTGPLNQSLAVFPARKLWRSQDFKEKRKLIQDCDKICRLRCYYRENLVDKIMGG